MMAAVAPAVAIEAPACLHPVNAARLAIAFRDWTVGVVRERDFALGAPLP
jgi:hypothetical protein